MRSPMFVRYLQICLAHPPREMPFVPIHLAYKLLLSLSLSLSPSLPPMHPRRDGSWLCCCFFYGGETCHASVRVAPANGERRRQAPVHPTSLLKKKKKREREREGGKGITGAQRGGRGREVYKVFFREKKKRSEGQFVVGRAGGGGGIAEWLNRDLICASETLAMDRLFPYGGGEKATGKKRLAIVSTFLQQCVETFLYFPGIAICRNFPIPSYRNCPIAICRNFSI